MRGLRVTKFTEFDKLSIEEIPHQRLEPKQLRIRVRAAGVSFSTNLVVRGKYQRKPPLPFTPGTECAGEVIEVGPNITRFKLGDRVCAALDWGAFAEEAIAWEVNTYPIPENLGFPEATNFNSYATSCAALTWPHLLNVQSGETLLVHGGAGAIGLAAIEIGKILNASVIATASTDGKCAVARSHGANHTINYSNGNFQDQVNDLTNGNGADAIIDPVGGDVFDQSLRCIAFEGRIAPIGFTSGRDSHVPANIILVKNITVCGLKFGTYYGWSPKDIRYGMEERVRTVLTKFYDWAKASKIQPHVGATFPLEGFKEAMDLVTTRRSIGRVVLIPN